MIRPATLADIPQLKEWGQRFADKANLTAHVGYCPESMAATFQHMIEQDNYTILVGENGAIGGGYSPHPFNFAHKFAQEVFWWSEGREGLRLLQAFEDWAREHCDSLTMITLESVNPERMAKFYRNRGFRPTEHSFLKVL